MNYGKFNNEDIAMTQYQILESFGGFDDFLLYLAISGVLLAVFVALYVRITPYRVHRSRTAPW